MYERFSDQARSAVNRAQEQARSLRHNYIGAEHILLGLLADEDCTAARALTSLDVSLEAVREQVVEIVGRGERPPSARRIPFTPESENVLELALRDALQLGSNSIGTEHILLGLIRAGRGVAVQILANLAGDTGAIRRTVVALAVRGRPEDVTEGSRPTGIAAVIQPQPGIGD